VPRFFRLRGATCAVLPDAMDAAANSASYECRRGTSPKHEVPPSLTEAPIACNNEERNVTSNDGKPTRNMLRSPIHAVPTCRAHMTCKELIPMLERKKNSSDSVRRWE
jgi:hypothetical protein